MGRTTEAGLLIGDRPHAGRPRPRRCGVARAAVDHHHLVDLRVEQRRHHAADRRLLVEAGDDDRDVPSVPPARKTYKLQRRPQFAQAVGGRSDCSAARKSRYRAPFQISRRVSCVASPSV